MWLDFRQSRWWKLWLGGVVREIGLGLVLVPLLLFLELGLQLVLTIDLRQLRPRVVQVLVQLLVRLVGLVAQVDRVMI